MIVRPTRRDVLRYGSAAALAVLPVPAIAQAWPSKPIKIVQGFPAGAGTHIVAQWIAEPLAKELGVNVLVEPRTGAGGNVGSEFVAKSPPDGYTLYLGTAGTHAINVSLYRNLPFDVQKDFAPITVTAFIPNLLVVNPSVPANNVADFITYLKANPDKLNFASAGNGTSQHLSGELFNSLAGVRMTHVAYRGGAPAVSDLLGGQVQVIFAPLVEVIQQVRADKLKALGITTAKRSPLLPDVPTILESLPGYEVALWNGLLAPAKTPPAIIGRLNNESSKVLAQPDVKARLGELGLDTVGGTPSEFDKYLRTESERWGKVIREQNLNLQE